MLPFLFALLFSACDAAPELLRLHGNTMGTSWNVTIVAPPDSIGQDELQAGIAAALEDVNQRMSNWKPDSEVSRFNRADVNTWIPVSSETRYVMERALDISRRSGGAFDVTVGPLIELWGFGVTPMPQDRVPAAETIAAAMDTIGFEAIALQTTPSAMLKSAQRAVNLSAIAKGYGVDRAAAWLDQQRVSNYLVEVGGELRTQGYNAKGQPWRVGIESPELLRGTPAKAIEVSGLAVATSGDYRNYFESDGVRYSHTLNPETGYPIDHRLASVSVIADNCTDADGWATALDVLGPEQGMALAESEGLAVYMIVRKGEGFESRHSSAFKPFIQ